MSGLELILNASTGTPTFGTNTGVIKNDVGDLVLVGSGGLGVKIIGTSGYDGIGLTTNPSTALHVNGTITATSFSGGGLGQFTTNSTNVYLPSGSNLGIGTSTPADALTVIGNVNASGYLKTGGAYAFGTHSSSTGSATGTEITLPYNTKDYDPNNCYSTSTYIYTVPINGMYLFSASCYGGSGAFCAINIGGTNVMKNQNLSTSVGSIAVSTSYLCTAGQAVKVSSYNGYVSSTDTRFIGCLLYAT